MQVKPFYRRLIANLGDANPFDYGGCFVFEQSDDPGDCEVAEVLRDALLEQDEEAIEKLRDQMERIRYEVHYWDETTPNAAQFVVFRFEVPTDVFAEHTWANLTALADLRKQGRDPDPAVRAGVLRDIGSYYGFWNLDGSPTKLSHNKMLRTYEPFLADLP